MEEENPQIAQPVFAVIIYNNIYVDGGIAAITNGNQLILCRTKIFNIAILCVVDENGKNEYWIVSRILKPRQQDTYLFKACLLTLGNRLIFRLENPQPDHHEIPVVAAIGDDGTENKMMLEKLDTEEIGCFHHTVDNYLVYTSPTDSAVPRIIGFSEGNTNVTFSIDELQQACNNDAFYGPDSLLSAQLKKIWSFKVARAQNINFAKYHRGGDHTFFQRTLQSVLSNPVDGDEEKQQLYMNLVVMLKILDALQKLALMLDEPLNGERRATITALHSFFTKVTIESPTVKNNLLTALNFVGSIYDRFPIAFKISIFSTAAHYALHAHIKAFNRTPTVTKFLEATNPPVAFMQNSYFGPCNYRFLELPPHLNS